MTPFSTMRPRQHPPAQIPRTGSPRTDQLAVERPATGQPAVRSLEDRFPHLASLNLHAGDWAALARQGFVAAERRGDRYYFKLRFRRQAAQIVRYLGSAARANAVRAELEVLQADTRGQRELRALGQRTSPPVTPLKDRAAAAAGQPGICVPRPGDPALAYKCSV